MEAKLEAKFIPDRIWSCADEWVERTVLFRPNVHKFGNFGLREGRKFYF